MRSITMQRLLVSAVAACWLSTASAELTFHLERIDAPDPTVGMVVNGLNDRGEVVGDVYGSVGGTRPFHWKNGRFRDLSDVMRPNGFAASAVDINGQSHIVGTYIDDATRLRTILVKGERTIEIAAGQQLEPVALNDRDEVIATSEAGAFAWRRGVLTKLQAFDASAPGVVPIALNNWGVIGGLGLTSRGYRPALWLPPYRDVIQLRLAPDIEYASANDINDLGLVVGEYSRVAASARRAFAWSFGRFRPLAKLYADQRHSFAYGVNNFGMIVGLTIDAQDQIVPTLWFGNRAYDLNDLVAGDDPLKDVQLLDAALINNRGQIISSARDSSMQNGGFRFYVLTPHW